MKMKLTKKLSSFFLCMMLIMAMAFVTTGCSDDKKQEATSGQESNSPEETVLGEGETTFTFIVTDKDGNDTSFEIHTNQTTVGEALLELELIAGEAGDYGLYVTEVNGITADYNVDGTYWAFYINDEYAMTGVDMTDITAGDTYAFKVEK